LSRNDCSFFAISGMRGSGRTRLFKELKSVLPQTFGDHKFAFFDDPLGGLPHPLLWASDERGLHPTTRVFKCWAPLNEFNIMKLKPAMSEHDFIFVDGYGLNAVLYATAYVGDNLEDDEASAAMHHLIVGARVIAQGIKPPPYFVTLGNRSLLVDYLTKMVPGISALQCEAFIEKEVRIIQSYFGPETGQTGHLFDPDMSLDMMCEFIIIKIQERIEEIRRCSSNSTAMVA